MPEFSVKIPELGESDSIGLLFALLPGLLCFLTIHVLTARERKLETLHVVLFSLAYNLLVHGMWEWLQWEKAYFPTKPIVGLPLTAIAIGILLATAINRGFIYRVLRILRITNESEWDSVWKTAHREHRRFGEFSVITFEDGSRLQGAIRYFSESQDGGHIAVEKFCWIDSENLAGPMNECRILFPAGSIKDIHFQPTPKVSRTLNNENDAQRTDRQPAESIFREGNESDPEVISTRASATTTTTSEGKIV